MTTNSGYSGGWRNRVKRTIRWLNAMFDQLFHVRFALITVGAGSAMVLAVPQVKELFFLLADNKRHWWLVYLATFFLALAVWYCGRTVFRFRFPHWPSSHPKILPGFKRIAPRVMGAMVPILMAIGCLIASLDVWDNNYMSIQLWLASGFFVAEAVIVWFLVVYRRPFLNRLKNRWGWVPDGVVPRVWHKETLNVSKPRQYSHWVRFVFLGGLALNLLVTLLAINLAHEMAEFLGPIATIMLAGTFFALTGTLITFAGTLSRIPLLSLMILFALALHALHVNDNHYVRQCPEMSSYGDPAECPPTAQQLKPGEKQQSLDQYWDSWSEGLAASDPVFLVSAEGGGIRAAAWTALVLSHLSDQTDGVFDRHLFAASGVSGGSLGIATYVSLIKARREMASFMLPSSSCADGEKMRCASKAILRQDFLGANLVNLFFVDSVQRFLPARLMIDRGQRLEESWARSWRRAFAGVEASNYLEAPFASLYEDGGSAHLPLALFNATVVQSGDRLIQSPFPLISGEGFDKEFPGARDSHDYLPSSMPLNAAVHNSARFTYISPAGTVAYGDKGKNRRMQVVDGGYFENSGTVTLGDVYRWLKRKKQLRNPVYVIHISNDASVPSMLENKQDACPTGNPYACQETDDNPLSDTLAGEASAPILALLRTRNARGENARQQLAQTVKANGETLMHFRLCDGDNQLPLGWALSDRAWSEMERQLGVKDPTVACFVDLHQKQMDSVLEVLGRRAPTRQAEDSETN